MGWRPKTELDTSHVPAKRARKDLIGIAIVVLIACIVIFRDPHQAFEWIAGHGEAQVDELLTAVVAMGIGFAIFSWRRWADLSRQVAEYKRLQAELSAINRDAAVMGETDDLLQSCLSTDEAYTIISRHFELQFPAMSGAIFILAHTRDMAELALKWGQPVIHQNLFPVSDCWALRRGRVNILLGSDPKLACSHIGSAVPAYAMCIPMMAQGEMIGILYLDTGVDPVQPEVQQFTDGQQRMVKTLAEHLALAVANLNLRETLRTQAIRDPLTGLFNRRYMEESLEREFHRAARKKTPLAILMVDIDHFKRFNDTYGHEAGDAVLRELARLFQGQLRAEDIASRFGGEEFTLILPEAGLEAAQECAERLRTAVHAMQIPHYGETLRDIRLSIGIACYPQHATTAEALMRSADAALYRAKENGRDQVKTAE